MATMNVERHPARRRAPAAPPRFSGLPDAGDRTKAFRAARRHSALVGLLRFAFPAAAMALGGLYFVPSGLTLETDAGTATVEDVDISSGALKMTNPRFQGVHDKHGVYDVRADQATQQISDPSLITLQKIAGDLTNKDGKKTTLSAPSGIFHSKKEELTFNNGVTIGGDAGFAGTFQTAKAFFQSNKLVTTDPVQLSFHGSTIESQSMTYYSSEGRAIFQGNVRVHLERQQGEQR